MKKKLLALLLAVMMIVTVLPVSVFAADAATQSESDSGAMLAVDDSLEAPAPADDDYFQLVNKVGAHLGYYKTIEEADAAWDDGYTIRLLKDYELESTWDVGSARGKVFTADADEGASEDPLNDATFDGQGNKLIANGFTAIELGADAHWDAITVKNLVVVSSGIAVCTSDAAIANVIFENCELYGDNAYYLFNPSFYEEAPTPAGAAAVYRGSSSSRIGITGADTVVASWAGPAVLRVSNVIELVDGFYYTHTGEVTVYSDRSAVGGTKNNIALNSVYIHGGTYVNRTKTVVAGRNGGGAYILGGTFLQTGENATAGTTLSAISVGMYDTTTTSTQNGIMYLIGGEFWVAEKSGCTSTPVVMDAGYSYLQLMGNPAFYGPAEWSLSGTTGTLVDGVRVGDYNVLNAITASAATKTYNNGPVSVSITAAYEQTVGMADDYSGAEALIYNKEEVLITALELDGSGNGYGNAEQTGGAAYVQATESATVQLRFSFSYIPAYGKMELTTSISATGVKDLLLGASGAAPITVDGADAYGFNLSGTYPMTFAYGANITFANMAMTFAGSGFNLGNQGLRATLTLDNVTMTTNGTAFLTNTSDVEVNLINGTTVTVTTETAYAAQLRGYARFNVKDSSFTTTSPRGLFHLSPDRRDVEVNNSTYYYDWIDNDAVITLDNATLLVTSGELEKIFCGSLQSNQATKCTDQQSEMRTTLTACNGTKINGTEFNTAVTVTNAAGDESMTVENATYAVDYMKEGFTLQLTEGAKYYAGVTLYLDSPAAAWTLDGNGATLYGGTGGYQSQPTNGVGALEVTGDYSDVTVTNLTIESSSYGFATGPDANTTVSALNLNNVTVNAIGLGRVTGVNNLVNITGESTVMAASGTAGIFEVAGALAIYNGTFNATAELAEDATPTAVFFAVKHPSNTANKKTPTLLTVYGGTFNAGAAVSSMIQTSNGANAVVLAGDFNFAATGAYTMLRPAAENYGYLEVQGGNFYAPNAEAPIYAPADAAKAYAIFTGGNFYGNVEQTTLVNAVYSTEDEEGNVIKYATDTNMYDSLYCGTRIDEVYGVTTENDVEGYAFVTTIAHENAATEETAEIAVTDGQGNTRYYYADELELAFSAVGDGGAVTLLTDITVDITNEETDFYADPTYTYGIETETFNHFVEYTINSDEANGPFNLWIQYSFALETATDADGNVTYPESSYFALSVLGGSVTFENVTVIASNTDLDDYENRLTFRALSDSNLATGVVINLGNAATILSDTKSTVKLFSSGATLNLYEGAIVGHFGLYSGVLAAVEIGGHDSTVNVYEGAWLGREGEDMEVYSTYAFTLQGDRNVINVYGGNLYTTASGGIFNVLSGAADNVINVYDGTFESAKCLFYDKGTRTVINALGGTFAVGSSIIDENGTNSVVNFGAQDGSTAPEQITTTYTPSIGAFVLNGGSGSTINVYAGTYTTTKHGFYLCAGSGQTVNIYGGSFSAADVFRGNTVASHATNVTVNAYAGTFTATTSMATIYGDVVVNLGVLGDDDSLITNNMPYIIVFNKGSNDTVNLYAGNYTTTNANGAVWFRGADCAFNMYGGTVTNTSQRVVHFNAAKNVVNVYGGTLSGGTSYAVHFNATDNTLNVAGGTISSPAATVHIVKANNTVTMTGGTLIAGATGCFSIGAAVKGNTIDVSGGYLSGPRIFYESNVSATSTIKMTGGTYKATNALLEAKGAGSTYTFGELGKDSQLIQEGTSTYPFVLNGATGSTLTVNAGTHTGTSAGHGVIWVKTGENNTVNFNGGTLITADTNAETNMSAIKFTNDVTTGGTVNITGGTVISEGPAFNVGGSVYGNLAVNISGGVLHSTADYVVSIGSALTTLSVAISGGVLISDVVGTDKAIFLTTHTSATIDITGGVFLTGNRAKFVTIPETCTVNLPGVYAGGTTMTHSADDSKVIYGENEYYMWCYGAATDEAYAGAMTKGAQIRLVSDTNGIRFVTTFTKTVVDALAALGEVTYGTLIVPADYLVTTGGVFTHAALEAAGLNYQDIEAVNGITVDANGNVTVRAALVNIKKENFARGYAAISYAKVGDTYYYGEFESLYNMRSAECLATRALSDTYLTVGTVNGKYYGYASIVEGVYGYTRYNAAQQTVLANFAGLTLKTEE